MKGVIFDIQSYAIYDGPGIRTLVFLKGCLVRCLWCHNPESQRLKPQISYFKDRCLKCGKCVDACPNDAIQLKKEGVIRNQKKCIVCGRCVDACPNDVMEKIGIERTVEEIIEIVKRDKPFYDNSGGGATISGGEPTFQFKFLIEILKGLKNEGIHTAIETCGYFNNDLLEELVQYVDLFLFDIKHHNSEMHKEFTGVKNEKILKNFSDILNIVGDRIICRIPLIPGFNTDLDVIEGIISFLLKVNYRGEVHLMPYNKLAKTKYQKIGWGEKFRDMGELTEEKIKEIMNKIEKAFSVICNK
ncbi:MAG: glycyl-radical enzyme activating protein [Candidatus Helarchaeota archaeon]